MFFAHHTSCFMAVFGGYYSQIVPKCVHALNGLTTEFLAVPLSSFSLHFAAPFLQSVPYGSVSI
jgi:hypothetical protein